MVAVGALAGTVAAILISLTRLLGWTPSWPSILGWFCLIAGPLAALDAWGAAMYRGRPREAWARLILVGVLFAAGAWVFFGLS